MSAAEEKVEQFARGNSENEWRIGFILIRSGRLKKEDVIRILQLQRENGMRFGDAAVELGVVSDSDIQFALAHQFGGSYFARGESGISAEVVAAYEPYGKTAEALRALRSQLMLRWFESNNPMQKAVAIAGPDRRAGRSWAAANLAVLCSQLGKNTVLVDGDLRHSAQHRFFGLERSAGLSEILCGRASLAQVMQRNRILPHLTVITAGTAPPNPQEVVIREGRFERLLHSLRSTVDVIIVDTPAATESADGQILARLAGGVMLVARRHVTRARFLETYTEAISSVGATLLLTVLTE